ncbi:PRC-barrel domain-containing protein [uncultured Clostridium sp.]|uniref:PRC-barrel domain-containing protein n=1 Tax=uncultured Clostridium sp. TaxID=59620 RepID=UPI00261B0473|nr:PRC-barrel domain-containing protein [uncultured Clostridium sp.]
MIRTKFFYMKKVYTKEGKYLGVVEDLAIDFFNGNLIGFKISVTSFISKKNFINIDKIISIDENIIVEENEKRDSLYFKEVKGLEIWNLQGHMLGVFEDLIINREKNSICGIILSTGIIDKIINGKKVLLIEDCVLGEDSIIYIGNENIELKIVRKDIRV